MRKFSEEELDKLDMEASRFKNSLYGTTLDFCEAYIFLRKIIFNLKGQLLKTEVRLKVLEECSHDAGNKNKK